jgi:hypothetical protein
MSVAIIQSTARAIEYYATDGMRALLSSRLATIRERLESEQQLVRH